MIVDDEGVAKKNYLQVTDEHFDQAVAPSSALQNAVQHVAFPTRGPRQWLDNGRYASLAVSQLTG